MRTVQRRRLATLAVGVVIVWGSLIGCGGKARPAQAPSPEVTKTTETIQIVSALVPPDTSALFRVITAVAENSGQPYHFQILEGTSFEASVQAVVDGKVDLTIVPQQSVSDEPVVFLEVFETPVVILVNSEPGIDNLTREQAAAIFSGEVTNWSQIGARDMDIAVFVQEESSSATIAFQNYFLGNGQFAEAARILFDDRDIVTVVNGLPGAIGYSLFAIKRLMEAPASDDLAVLAGLDGLFPGDLNYPISASVGLVYLPERQDDLQTLLDWGMDFLDSELGQFLQKQYGVSAVTSTRFETEGGDNAHLD